MDLQAVMHPIVEQIIGDLTPQQLHRLAIKTGIGHTTIKSWFYDLKTPRIDLLYRVAKARGMDIMVKKPNALKIITSAKGRVEAWKNNRLIGYTEDDTLYGMDADGYAVPIGPISHRVEIGAKLAEWAKK